MSTMQIALTGELCRQDFLALVHFLREIDERNPDRAFAIIVTGGDMGMEEAATMLREALPPMSGHTVSIRSVPLHEWPQ